MRFRNVRQVANLTVVLALANSCVLFAESAYRESVEKWRRAYQASLTSDTGWLTVSGLFWLKEGENRIGSAAANDIVLPASAPASVGVLTFHAGKSIVHVNPGIAVTLNGKPVETAELRPDSSEDHLVLGDLTLFVHASGNRLALRLRDKNSQLRKSFSGLNWFPIDESYATTGKYIPYESPKDVDSQNVLSDAIKLKITGYVTFPLKGQEYRLEGGPTSSGKFFIGFRDLTSGKETYPASRFLDVELPPETQKGGLAQIDFNKAYNPPCAYNPYTTCPLPLPGNRLKIEIPAGEKLYKHDHGV
jgi:uncharacterized protein (DUF1684 family)